MRVESQLYSNRWTHKRFIGDDDFSFSLRSHFPCHARITMIIINLLVVYRESTNLMAILLVDYLLIVYGKIVARVIVYVTLFQTRISTHGVNGAPRLNLMKHKETVLFNALLNIFFSFMQCDYE